MTDDVTYRLLLHSTTGLGFASLRSIGRMVGAELVEKNQ